ncbi:MAG: hypothetical protein WC799_08335 [Desulfobacteraceae bacterium]|jgi:hypothetical protein
MKQYEIETKLHDVIKLLPPHKLKIALDFLEDLTINDEDETKLLLKEPGFLEDYKQAKKDIQTGNTVNWKDIKRNV